MSCEGKPAMIEKSLVMQMVNRLADEAKGLEEAVQRQLEKLMPISSQEQDACEAEARPEEPIPLIGLLDDILHKFSRTRQRLEDLTNRVAL